MNSNRTAFRHWRRLSTLVVFFLSLSVVALYAPAAQACGGFFCSTNAPVNQAAERIIFAQNDDGTVTAVIQILFEGPSERFAWVLPVVGSPEVSVSSNAAFQRLQSATNPQYNLTVVVEGACGTGMNLAGTDAGAQPQAAGSPDAAEDDRGVNVIAAGTVGPFDYEVIEVIDGADDAALVAVDWLEANDYDVTAIGPDVLRPYLENSMNLIAFRLTKGADTGEIRPVMLTYEGSEPCIPIRPTAVAANDNMGVMVFLMADYRAIPDNYLALELNDALINWFNANTNYNDVVSAAADEANGQGFVAEMASSSDFLAGVIWTEFDESNYAALVERDWTEDTSGGVLQAFYSFGQYDGFDTVLRETVPTPDGLSDEDFRRCPDCYLGNALELEDFNATDFLNSLNTNVMEPLLNTQDLLLSRPYMTRLYTTMSAGDMSIDPVFEFNPDLGDVSNIHNATQVIECHSDVMQSDAPWRIELESGNVIRGEARLWPVEITDMPANRQIRDMSSSGQGTLVTDNTVTIQQALETNNRGFRTGDDSSSCGCSSVSSPAAAAPPLAALLGLAIVTRRRRQR